MRLLCSLIWRLSESTGLSLGWFAPYIFGGMIGRMPRKLRRQVMDFEWRTELTGDGAVTFTTLSLSPSPSDGYNVLRAEIAEGPSHVFTVRCFETGPGERRQFASLDFIYTFRLAQKHAMTHLIAHGNEIQGGVVYDSNGAVGNVGELFNFAEYPCADAGEEENVDMQVRVLASISKQALDMLELVKTVHDWTQQPVASDTDLTEIQLAFSQRTRLILRNLESDNPRPNINAVLASLGWPEI